MSRCAIGSERVRRSPSPRCFIYAKSLMKFKSKFITVALMMTCSGSGRVKQRTTQPKSMDIRVVMEEVVGTEESQEKICFRQGNCEFAFERRGRGLGHLDVGSF